MKIPSRAFEEEQFLVYFQPQYNYTSKKIIGAEALVRWFHPLYGMQSPGDFIPVYESSGYITRLDLYVFEKICAFLRKCIDKNVRIVPISFNVSRYDVYGGNFIEDMEAIRKRYDIPVTYFRIEITESSLVGGNEYMIRIVESLHSSRICC